MHTIYRYCIYNYVYILQINIWPGVWWSSFSPRGDGDGPYMYMNTNKMIQVCVYLYVYNSVMYTYSVYIYKCK